MFRLESVLQLKDDEDVRAITRRHILTLLPGLSLALLLIVTPFFLLFPLFGSGPPGVVLFLVLTLVGLFVAVRTFVLWDGDVFIITSLRIIDVDQTGLFSRMVSEVKVEDIQDVSWSKRHLLDMLFGMGKLRVQTYSGALVIEAAGIPRPQILYQLMNDLRLAGAAKRHGTSRQPTTLRARLSSRLEALSEEELSKLERTLSQEDREIAIKKLFGTSEDRLKPMADP